MGDHAIEILSIEYGGSARSNFSPLRPQAIECAWVFSALWIAFFALLGPARAEFADTALSAAIDGAWREPQSRARDAYRHPNLLFMFWGLKPGMTVIEVDPGVRGWWTEILLAPYARATGGAYIATPPDRAQSGAAAESPDAAHAAFWKGVADKSVFGEVKAYDFGPQHPDFIPAGSVDLVLVARGRIIRVLGALIHDLAALRIP